MPPEHEASALSAGEVLPSSTDLRALLDAARARTLACGRDLDGPRLLGPRLAIVNPPLWEIGHVGWFQEYWCLRHRSDAPALPSLLPRADELYNSATVAHDTRWDLPLPDLEATLHYLQQVLEGVHGRLEQERCTGHLAYFTQLAAFHEEMHCEAFTYTRQTLGYPAPFYPGVPRVAATNAGPLTGDAAIAGGLFTLGAVPEEGFVFDNEKWAHQQTIEPFEMARAAVTNAEFAAFVDDGGYDHAEWWCEAGWRWRTQHGARTPVYWRKEGNTWIERRYDHEAPLRPHAAVIHVNWFEADAYCRWAGRRLPTEAEWECAAAGSPHEPGKRRYPWGTENIDAQHANLFGVREDVADVGDFAAGDSAWGCRQMFGNAWEWTADWFHGYPGFQPDPYKEYSQPWFGDHKVLRGGCYATRSALLRNTFRNFYTPDRRDVFAGFRTCARRSAYGAGGR